MHPYADEQEDECREHRAEAFRHLAARPADRDEALGDPPGRGAGDERDNPPGIDPAQQRAPLGLDEEADHRDDDEQRLKPFAHEDGEGADEGGRAVGGGRGHCAFRLGEEALDPFGAGFDIVDRCTTGDRGAKPAHFALDRGDEAAVAGVEDGFDRLEPVEIGAEREIAGMAPVSGAVGLDRLAQQCARDGEGGDAAILIEHVGIGAKEGKDGLRPLRADLARQLRRSEADQRLEIGDAPPQAWVAGPLRLALLAERIGIGEAGDVKGERPAILRGELRPALHRGALDALADHLVISEEAALAGAVPVGEGDRRGIERVGRRRVGMAVRAMAGGAILGVERGATVEIGRSFRRQPHRIGSKQVIAERAGAQQHLVAAGLADDRGLELARLGDQRRTLRACRQGSDPCDDRAGKFDLFVIFRLIDDAAVLDRPGIIHRHIVEHPPGGLHLALVRARRACHGKDGEQEGEKERGKTDGADGHGSLMRMRDPPSLLAIDYQ